MTRGDVLRYRLAYALIRASKIVRGLRQGLTEPERYAVADHVVAQLNEHGDPWQLSEEAATAARADDAIGHAAGLATSLSEVTH